MGQNRHLYKSQPALGYIPVIKGAGSFANEVALADDFKLGKTLEYPVANFWSIDLLEFNPTVKTTSQDHIKSNAKYAKKI